MDLYAETILHHYRHPQGRTLSSHSTVVHTENNPACGDEITLHLTLKDECIQKVGWEGTGCAISMAGMSMMYEKIQNISINDALTLSPDDMLELLGVPIGARRLKCALLPLHTLKNALLKAASKDVLTWSDALSTVKEAATIS